MLPFSPQDRVFWVEKGAGLSPCKASASSSRCLCLNAVEGAGQAAGRVAAQAASLPSAAPACRRCNECTGLSQGSGTRLLLAVRTRRGAGGSAMCQGHGEVAAEREAWWVLGWGSLPKAPGAGGGGQCVPCRGDHPRGGRSSVSSPAPARQLSLQGVWLGPERQEPCSPPPASFISSPSGAGAPAPPALAPASAPAHPGEPLVSSSSRF